MDESMREVGLRLQGLREACDVTVEEMAHELGVSPGTYAEWEEFSVFTGSIAYFLTGVFCISGAACNLLAVFPCT